MEIMEKTKLILVKPSSAMEDEIAYFNIPKDLGLNEIGKEQSLKLSKFIESINIDTVFSCSSLNAVESAKFIASLQNTPVVVSDEINTINGGHWNGLSWKEICDKWPREVDIFNTKPYELTIPGGESINSFKNRLLGKVQNIVNQNIGKTLLIVMQQHSINVLISYFKGLDYQDMLLNKYYANSSISIIGIEHGNFTVVKEGNISHLVKVK